MPKYNVVSPLRAGARAGKAGRKYQPGETIELDAPQAKHLLELGRIEEQPNVKDQEPKKPTK